MTGINGGSATVLRREIVSIVVSVLYQILRPEIARDALQDIIVHLRQQVTSHLRIHWEQEAYVDFAALQDVCDSSQDRTILVLMQLQQRIVTAGPLDSLAPAPLNVASRNISRQPTMMRSRSAANMAMDHRRPPTPPHSPSPAPGMFTPPAALPAVLRHSGLALANVFPESTQISPQNSPPIRYTQMSPYSQPSAFSSPAVPARTATPSGNRPYASFSVPSSEVSDPPRPRSSSETPAASMKNHFAEKGSFFGLRKKRTDSEEAAAGRPNRASSFTNASIRSNGSGSSIRHGNASPQSLDQFRTGYGSFAQPSPNLDMEMLTVSRSTNPKDLLPNETNKFAGFCKGAWRQQIGDRKKAMEDRVRPGGMYNAAKFWQCRSCKFEGRLVPLSKKQNAFDTRVFRLVEGVQFRWEFLFKSHIVAKDSTPDPTKGTFGCIFCCSEGRGTPIFEGVGPFMQHLALHRARLPTGEVLYRMNCVVGRPARQDEDFDVNIVSSEGCSF